MCSFGKEQRAIALVRSFGKERKSKLLLLALFKRTKARNSERANNQPCYIRLCDMHENNGIIQAISAGSSDMHKKLQYCTDSGLGNCSFWKRANHSVFLLKRAKKERKSGSLFLRSFALFEKSERAICSFAFFFNE